MVLYDPQEFGGLEEYATTLAVGLHRQGQQVSVLSATWVPPENQYLRRLRDNGVTFVQVPKWLSYPASHWATKEKILAAVLWLFSPIVYVLGGMLFLLRRRSWTRSLASACNWLRGQLTRFIGPDRRKPLTRLLLDWWRLRWHPDLLHIQGYTSTLLFVIEWAHAKRVPVVYEEHQTPDAQFDWWQNFQRSINKSTRVVAVSEKSANALREVCGVTRPIVIRPPLMPDPLEFGWQRDDNRWNGRLIAVTTVARLYVTKGLGYLLDAVALVKKTHLNVQFRVYGEGELRQELLDRAWHLGLNGEEIFVGAFTNREELSRIMAKTDIFLLSSILEGQPLAIVEAMAYGCPIVATAVGGIPELIQDGINGLLCKPADPECLAEKVRMLIDDPALRLRLGAAARESYERGSFQMSAVSAQFTSVYEDVLHEVDGR